MSAESKPNHQTEIAVYIATTLDGFIADAKGGLDWLTPYENLDYGYGTLIATVDAVIMGRNTYHQMAAGGAWPYAGLLAIVLSSQLNTESNGREQPQIEVEFWDLDPKSALQELSRRGLKRAWISGGGALISSFLAADLVTTVDLCVVPTLLHGGIRLFQSQMGDELLESPTTPEPSDTFKLKKLVLRGTESYSNGVVKLSYSMPKTRDSATVPVAAATKLLVHSN